VKNVVEKNNCPFSNLTFLCTQVLTAVDELKAEWRTEVLVRGEDDLRDFDLFLFSSVQFLNCVFEEEVSRADQLVKELGEGTPLFRQHVKKPDWKVWEK